MHLEPRTEIEIDAARMAEAVGVPFDLVIVALRREVDQYRRARDKKSHLRRRLDTTRSEMCRCREARNKIAEKLPKLPMAERARAERSIAQYDRFEQTFRRGEDELHGLGVIWFVPAAWALVIVAIGGVTAYLLLASKDSITKMFGGVGEALETAATITAIAGGILGVFWFSKVAADIWKDKRAVEA